MKYRHLTDDSDDIRIPRQMTEKLNLPHHVFDTTLYHDPDSSRLSIGMWWG